MGLLQSYGKITRENNKLNPTLTKSGLFDPEFSVKSRPDSNKYFDIDLKLLQLEIINRVLKSSSIDI